jgi:hypothetical protein
MQQPLVSRPPYGEGRQPIAVAELPSGGPSDRGIPLDSGIPGTNTFAKPVDDYGTSQTENKRKDESIYRKDSPRDLGKARDRIDVKEDSKDCGPSFYGLGKPDKSPVTRYPYRDEIPNAHNASVEFVAGLWILKTAHVCVFHPSTLIKVSMNLDQVLEGLDVKFKQRAQKCTVTLKRADIPNLRWIFSVDSGHGPKAVKVRAIRSKKNVTKFSQMDLELACSCPAWQWWGPEFHAHGEKYLLNKARGTAATPDIRDPERDNRVCKHVAAVLTMIRDWEIPK